MGALSLTASSSVYRRHLGGLLVGVEHVPYPTCHRCAFGHSNRTIDDCCGQWRNYIQLALDTLVHPDDLAAIVVEPILGEGGYQVPPADFLPELRSICDRTGALLICDEVQTGLGRTGTFLACEAEGVLPDVVTLSKSLGGGIPLGALLARGEAARAFVPGSHASTFGGNPVCCAAALAFLATLDADKLLDRVRETGDWFMDALRGLASRQPKITSVRGRGLLIAVDLSVPAKTVALAAEERGYLVNAVQEQSLRFAPPFIVKREELTAFLSVLEEILNQE